MSHAELIFGKVAFKLKISYTHGGYHSLKKLAAPIAPEACGCFGASMASTVPRVAAAEG